MMIMAVYTHEEGWTGPCVVIGEVGGRDVQSARRITGKKRAYTQT